MIGHPFMFRALQVLAFVFMASTSHAADFNGVQASSEARETADWVSRSGDNLQMPFAIIDKVNAQVFVFDFAARLLGSAPVLLGSARGDDSAPGIGTRKLSAILPNERTTPAGRFIASLSKDIHGSELLWVDYESAVALHPVVTSNVRERRSERLASPTPEDNRITYGCINVSAVFYSEVVSAAFTRTNGVVYVLPETRSARDVFMDRQPSNKSSTISAKDMP